MKEKKEDADIDLTHSELEAKEITILMQSLESAATILESIAKAPGVNPSFLKEISEWTEVEWQSALNRNGYAGSIGEKFCPRNGITEITAERGRQIRIEGWTSENDDCYKNGELVRAAICYLRCDSDELVPEAEEFKKLWPWSIDRWKPSPDARVNRIKAGALIAAEIDRIDRMRKRVGENLLVNLQNGQIAARLSNEELVWHIENSTLANFSIGSKESALIEEITTRLYPEFDGDTVRISDDGFTNEAGESIIQLKPGATGFREPVNAEKKQMEDRVDEINSELEKIAADNPGLFDRGLDRPDVEERYRELLKEAGVLEAELGR